MTKDESDALEHAAQVLHRMTVTLTRRQVVDLLHKLKDLSHGGASDTAKLLEMDINDARQAIQRIKDIRGVA